MRIISHAIALAIAVATPALAEEEQGSLVSVVLDNYILYDSGAGAVFSGHGATVTFETTTDGVTFGAEFWAGLTGDFNAGTLTFGDPTIELSLAGEAWGELEIYDASGALDDACVMPSPGSTHFGTENLMSVSTCAGYGGGKFVLYTTPEVRGFTMSVGAMRDIMSVVAFGDVDTSVSAAIAFNTTMNDVTYNASLGVDHAVGLAGGVPPGTPLPTTVQAGLSAEWHGWTAGVAAQYEVASVAGGDAWAAGIGLSREVIERLTVAAEVATVHYLDAGTPMQELSVGATAEYEAVPDAVWVDAGVNLLRRTGGGLDEVVASVGSGVSVAF